MDSLFKIPDKGDPSDILQLFPSYNLQLLCCRYWWLKKWEFKELSYPYWRVYFNMQKGAYINYKGTEYELSPDKIILIVPNTSFATHLYNAQIPEKKDTLEGGRVGDVFNENELTNQKCVLHLFIHFNIGMPYDKISPGIFIFEHNDNLREKTSFITKHLSNNYVRFDFHSVLVIHSLISDLLSKIPGEKWKPISKDSRIFEVLTYIEKNLEKDLSDIRLSQEINLSTQFFRRLFKNEVGVSPKRYVIKKRIDKACALLLYSKISVNEIAELTGYSDRYHFSREFKKQKGVSPAKYRKEVLYP